MKTLTLTIDGFDYNARGVARHDGKTVFVSGALPGERVVARITADKKRYLETDAVQILEPSPARITRLRLLRRLRRLRPATRG